MTARRILHRSVSRDTIARLDLPAVKVITVSSLEAGGSPAHLRYLLGRLRHRAPHAVLITVLCPRDEPVLNEAEFQNATGGDRCVSSLREGIDATLAALNDRRASKDLAGGEIRSETPARPNR